MEPSNELEKCGPECGPECAPDCGPECEDCQPAHAEQPQARDSTLVKTVDGLVLAMFVVGVYTQVFSLFLYAFG